MLGTLLNLNSHVRVPLKIFCQPDRAKVTPTQLLNDHVSIKQNFTNVNWMVSSNLVVWHTFILAGVLLIEKCIIYHIF